MSVLIADTSTGSPARPTGEKQKIVKTTAFDLQMNPAASALRRVGAGEADQTYEARIAAGTVTARRPVATPKTRG